MTYSPSSLRPALFPLGLILFACGPTSQTDEVSAETSQTSSLTQVITTPVVAEDLSFSITVPGSVQAIQSADLYARVGGYLSGISVDLGDTVSQDQILARIAVPEMHAELSRASAMIELSRSQVAQQAARVTAAVAGAQAAEANKRAVVSTRQEKIAQVTLRQSEFERWQVLVNESSAIEPRKLDEARQRLTAAQASLAAVDAAVAAAEAQIQQAIAEVDQTHADERAAHAGVQVAEASYAALVERIQYSTIKAPFPGVITERHVHPGALIQAADSNSNAKPLLRLERVDRVRIEIHLPMDAAAALDKGDRISFGNLINAPGAHFEGTITRTAGALGQRSRMMRAEVELDNPANAEGQRQLQPGAYGDLTVFLEQFKASPTVPASAVFTRNGELSVFVLDGSTLHLTPITAIFQDGSRVGVSRGLKPGQLVVASGFSELSDGQTVRTPDGGR
jgi:RND family efflux transporter MFP subunit